MRVAVFGTTGQLGAAVAAEFSNHHDVAALDHQAVDITDAAAVERTLLPLRPDVIINCAGNNAVDAAEDHQAAALDANAFVVRTLARAARASGSVLVHYSSDFVFDGTAEKPYTEADAPNPRSVYAMSKMVGEWFAADVARHYVLRVESLFGAVAGGRPEKGSAAAIVSGLRAGTSPKVFVDRTVSPTYVIDAARATREIVERELPPGLYHCVNSGSCTWLEFAQEAARLLGVEARLTPIRLEDVPLKAPRPKFCALSNQKLALCGIVMPDWQDALRRSLAR
ncbi:MAG TPA: dTDP-4-dehydrorhamnose reductase [Vicinamibacterales bacterium]|jgi:dTDP-4-dehydrorhamnose reductase|nr:dTDP-4-dehydrorhamnose reductase [Vicinamibacterales bacterium]